MPKLDHDGVSLHYEVRGDGPTILLTHGYAATGDMWLGQADPLSARYRLVTWDMRGHGRSDYPDDPAAYSEAATVADMAAILDAVGAETAVIGGLSLGGYMSLAFHRTHPRRTRALLIFDCGPGYRDDAARAKWNEHARGFAADYETQGLARLQAGGPEMHAGRHRDASGLAKAARGMLTQSNAAVLESLPHIAVPTLVLAGGDDTPFLKATDYMAAKIPGAEKVIIPDAGHAANIDQPEAFNRAVLAFLDRALA